MTKQELSEALKIANSEKSLENVDIEIFDGYGLKNFQPIYCTVEQLARLIRWQCFQLNGKIDDEELNNLAYAGKKKFLIVG